MKLLFIIIFSFLLSVAGDSQPDYKETTQTANKYEPVEKTIFYKLGDRDIPIKILQYGEVKDIVCMSLHSNEYTSVQAAMSVLESKGGTLIKVENGDQRVIRFRFRGKEYGFDPNQMFSRIGIGLTLKENGRSNPLAISEIEKFATRLLILIPEKTTCIVALHNNTDEAYSVKSYLPKGDRRSDAKAVYADSSQDADDIAFTTDRYLFQKMADNNYNSVWQDNLKAKRDGSLSVYCGEKDLRYINIETQHGKVQQYQEMLEKLLTILADENKKPSGKPEDSQ
ncbi:MAG: hypothetical protein HZB42_13715 [Sphingobacteriales bacterium]|nr:hypothetical protein [Sphingobacteriales bacterium]